MSKTFCPLPWISVAARNNGDMRVCCHSTNSTHKGFAFKDDGSIFNFSKDSVQDFRNTSLLKQIRRSMLSGEWHDNCIRCKNEVESGVRARINYERELRSQMIDLETARKMTQEDGTIDVNEAKLTMLDIRFGNQCNLACRTCNPTESNQWYRDHYNIYGDTFKLGDQKIRLLKNEKGMITADMSHFNWYESDFFKNNISEYLSHVQEIYMAGGEPLKVKQHLFFLKKIIDLGLSQNITLEYNTNGYMVPAEVWELWSQFKHIKIGLSIDSIHQMNDYIRYPSKWSLLENNIRKFDLTGETFTVWLCLTVSIYNIYYLPEIITWRLLSNFKKINNFFENLAFSDHPLHNPKHLNIQSLPPEIKSKISHKFDSFKKQLAGLLENNDFTRRDIKTSYEKIAQMLDSYVSFMGQVDSSDHFDKFLNYTSKLDLLRGDSFKETFPEFSRIVAESSKKISTN